MVIRPGRAPIRSSGGYIRAALRILRSLGSNAHVWLPGASGVSVASLPSNNYLLSDFATLAAVDEVVGGVKDGMNPSGGISLTQPTTANKPLVRRGLMNYLPYSGSFITNWPGANMTKVAAPDPYGGMLATQVTTLGGTTNLYTNNVLLSANGVTMAAIVKGVAGSTHSNTFGVYNQTTGLDLRYVSVNCLTGAVTGGTGASTPLGDGWFLVVVNISTGINSGNLGYVHAGYAGSIQPVGQANIVYRAALFHGIYTAAQILAEGGIPTTTATAASNPSAGKYWWSLDGSNNSLLSGNLGITNACTIVISLRVNSLAATQIIFAEDTNGAQVSIATNGAVSLTKVGGAALVTTAAGVVVAGVPLVLTVRLSAGTADIRKNGAQSATAASALTFSAVTGARVGTAFNGTSNPTGGAFGWVVPSAVGLSDADCLTVERLVGSQFPGMAVF